MADAIPTAGQRWATQLDPGTETFLRATNLWWAGEATPPLPRFRRWLFEPAHHRLTAGLAPITVLRGPRQVGKTTLQQQLIRQLLDDGVDPRRLFHVQFDELPAFQADGMPILKLVLWFEHHVLGGSGLGGALNEWAHRGTPVYLIFDEIQNLTEWAPQLKSLVDHHAVRVFLTGSSALRIEQGRDSLAGRISTLEMGTLLLREIAALRGWGELAPALAVNGIAALRERRFWEELRARGREHRALRDRAFAAFAERGGYPIAQVRPEEPWDDLADYLSETVVRRVLHHDLGRGTDPKVLEEVFRLACRYAGQDPGAQVFVPEIRGSIEVDVDWPTILTHLRALSDSLLLRRVPPLELRLKRQGRRHKLCLCDHSLRAAWLRETVPLTPADLAGEPARSRLAGPLAESIVGAFFAAIPGIDVAWHPARSTEPEIDFVLTVGAQRIPVEVKYRHKVDPRRDVAGLCSFVDKEVNQAPFGILLTLGDGVEMRDPRIVAVPLASLLLMR
ncbi:MAG: ATP-binding protein [bacterium]|nr:ATP-binding protein [bacterium]